MSGGFAATEIVRQLVADLPGVSEAPSYRTPGFRVRKKLFARIHQSEPAVVVRIDPEDRPALLRSEPDSCYLTDHYAAHPWVLVRADADAALLRELLVAAWRSAAPPSLVREWDAR